MTVLQGHAGAAAHCVEEQDAQQTWETLRLVAISYTLIVLFWQPTATRPAAPGSMAHASMAASCRGIAMTQECRTSMAGVSATDAVQTY